MELWDSDRARAASVEQSDLLQELHEAKRACGLVDPEELYGALCDRLSPSLAIALHSAEHKFLRLVGEDDGLFLGYLLAIEWQGEMPLEVSKGKHLLLHRVFEFSSIHLVTISSRDGVERFSRGI